MVRFKLEVTALNIFSQADDLALLAPSTSALNPLVMIYKKFSNENLTQFNDPKSVVLLVSPPAYKLRNRRNIYLGGNFMFCVEEFRYIR